MYTLQHVTDALKAYDSKPDCFKDAARALRQGCKSIDIDEDEKTRCKNSLLSALQKLVAKPISLSRVPQLWTSYSGYFREVKVMCLAVRYSLEHDELRSLQRNLSRTHSDQIRLLKEQQRILKETNRLETERLKELSDLHSTIATQVNSMLSSTGALRDSLRSVSEEVSRLTESIERGALQQSAALSTTQEVNTRILAEYQDVVHSTLASVSQSMQQWHDSLQLGLSRTQEVNRLNQDSIIKILHSNEALHALTNQTSTLKHHLQNLTYLSLESTNTLLDLHTAGTHKINASAQELLQSTLQSLLALESQTHTAWSTMLDTFHDDTALTGFRTDVADALKGAVGEIEQMARESRENVERLNIVVAGFWKDQENVLAQVRPLFGAWAFARNVLERENVMTGTNGGRGGGGGLMLSWMGSGFVLLFFVVVAVLTLIHGLRTVRKSINPDGRVGSDNDPLVVSKVQRDGTVKQEVKYEQELEKEHESDVEDGYGNDDDDGYEGGYAESYFFSDSAEEEEEGPEKKELAWQQNDDDDFEQQASALCNNPNVPETPTPSIFKRKPINQKSLTQPSADMDMEMWERLAASWDLGLGTCVSSSSTSSEIY
ncbi:hypothetical protein BG015_003056 [Linnemannia schmuckeri]|uniref:Karyogamy protein 5 n=1 Tax=Linnemannia schmuckeri TaxID=64567 RepID=A0A9P5RND4_9FUNG|nr:hypothetical protein BG015_003056 [Linnemannia schmuckeri]